jgi:uncharacterized membrane protein YsdA (DUF1294 family)
MVIFAVWNLIVFAIYGYDKYNAINGRPRVSERTLISFAFLFGGLGAFLGMQVFRHKRRHRVFQIGVPIALVFNIALLYVMHRLGLI